jgi:hypothetical protein
VVAGCDSRPPQHPVARRCSVDRELMKIARGEPPAGSIERMVPTDPSRYRLRLQSARVLFWVDRQGGVIHVTRVFRD